MGSRYTPVRVGDTSTDADQCDGCGAPMKYKRIAVPVFYACESCTDKAVRALGRTHGHVALGIRR